MSLLPLTVMCISVTLFHLNTLRPPWSVFVLMAQVLSVPPLLQTQFEYARLNSQLSTTVYVSLATLFSPWNLDFFRALYNSICISPHITNIQSAAIEGSIGLYPLVLLCVLYSVVKLHDRGSRIFATLWKPFHILLSRFRQKLNLKSSLIDTFATFILLSYIKISITAFYILSPMQLWSPDGSYEWVVYYDPSIVYFGPSHIAYAIITLIHVTSCPCHLTFPLPLPLVPEMSHSLSPEITGSQCLCGCLSRMLQRRNRRDSRRDATTKACPASGGGTTSLVPRLLPPSAQ